MNKAELLVSVARKAYRSGRTKPIQWRLAQLNRLLDMVSENQQALANAVYKDFKKNEFEVTLMEIIIVKNEIITTMRSLETWMKPEYVPKNMVQKLDSMFIMNEPRGVMLIMGAWNYPIMLTLRPLCTAIAAGNACIVKPSEISPATAETISELVPKYLDNECYSVYCGGIKETTLILEQKFNLILYTGSGFVGKIVMTAAAKHLTPVILELGGKSPVYVHNDSDIEIVCRRIAWGKFVNGGQTCTAPDYVVCHKDVVGQFTAKMKETIKSFYGEDPSKSPDLARIVNERNFERIGKLMDGMPESKVVYGGTRNSEEKYIAPTIYGDVEFSDSIMSGELFGPLLPVVTVSSHEEAIEKINEMDKPLALYVFTKNNKIADQFLAETSSGGVTVNDVLMHASGNNLPFGGVGESGMGSYFGKFGFDAFSHKKPVCWRKQNLEALLASRYPPYTKANLSMISWLIGEKKDGYCNIM